MDYLNRQQAPFPDKVWRALDKAAVAAARDRLTARRFLPIEGPFGVGLTAIECGNDEVYRQPRPVEAASVMGRTQPVPMIRQIFRLSVRRIAAFIENGQPLDLSAGRGCGGGRGRPRGRARSIAASRTCSSAAS